MSSKRPYSHILKNLLHEQAAEILPILIPGCEILEVLDVEMPELRTISVERPPNDFEKGVASLALPGAEVTGIYKTEWIEHSGNFERFYRFHNDETDKLCYLVIEFQLDREELQNPPLDLSATCVHFYIYANKILIPEMEASKGEVDEDEDEQSRWRRRDQSYYVYPYMLCPFPSAVPAHIRNEFMGRTLMEFNFLYVKLWENDAREFLNTHVSATYFLLPAMKNADATLLGLAIEELAQRFQHDEAELGRYLTGLNLMLHMSELMPEEEKLAAQERLKPYAHLIKSDPLDE